MAYKTVDEIFTSSSGTFAASIDHCLGEYTRVAMNTLNCDEQTARRCIGMGIEIFISLVNTDVDTALIEAAKLSTDAPDTATTYGLAKLFNHHGLTSGSAVRGKTGELEDLGDALLYPEGDESEEDGGDEGQA